MQNKEKQDFKKKDQVIKNFETIGRIKSKSGPNLVFILFFVSHSHYHVPQRLKDFAEMQKQGLL